jgi:predicted RNase H-like HicB family nuclease
MLTRYIETAMRRARYEWLAESNEYYGEIAELPGVWATGATRDSCAEELQEVLEDWIALGLAMHHQFPVIDGINVNIEAVA